MTSIRPMNPRPIAAPLDGEHVAGVFPRSAADLAVTWHRRLNLFTGRSLTAPALDVEQTGRGGRFALRGQVLSPGIVQGLETSLDTTVTTEQVGEAERTITRHFIQISSGLGMAASGEDVVVPQPLHINLGDIEVIAPASLQVGDAEPAPPPPGVPVDPLPTPEALEPVREPPEARRIWDPLRDLLRRNAPLPSVGILLLQPVVIESIASREAGDECGSGSTNPCELDPESFAFEDWQLVDGCRLLLYAWPSDWLSLPARDARWRNRVAWSVFNAERDRGPDEPMPWEQYGVPIALIGFDSGPSDRTVQWDLGELSWTPLFADRNAVARMGGRPKRRSRNPASTTNPFLWQARVQQLAEQVTGLNPTDTRPGELAAPFRYLPPVGLLPKNAIDPRGGHDHFFPNTYVVNAAPIPLEQIDILLEESAGLSPFDLDTADEVRAYVPVPQIWYEPNLLQTELVDAEFQRSIDAFTLRRGRWLARRNEVRAKSSALSGGVNGKPREFPSPDPDALEEEEAAPDPIDPNDPRLQKPEDPYGTTAVGAAVVADTVIKLKSDLRARTPLRERTRIPLAALSATFPFPASSAGRISYDLTAHVLEFTGRMTTAQRDDLLAVTAGDVTYRTAVGQLFTTSQDDDFSRIDELGVSGFIDYLTRKSSDADDRIDFGFLRVRTDIYRVRQFMLGTDSASRLTTSPALAEIAQGSSAVASQEALSTFLQRVKIGGGVDSPSAAPIAGGAGGGIATGAGAATGVNLGAFTVATGERFTASAAATGPSSSSILAPSAPILGTTIGAGIGTTGGIFAGGTTVGIGGLVGTRIEQTTAGLSQAARSEVLQASSGLSALNVPLPTEIDVTRQSPIVGKSLEFRSVSVAERLTQPVAPETKSFSVASKYSVLSDVSTMGINIDDLSVPGFLNANHEETRHTFGDIRSGGLLTEVLQDRHDPDPANGDEASFFSASVRALENTIATLRVVEGRIQSYRAAIEIARAALAELQKQLTAADVRLRAIAEELAEARHDVSVAKALLAEEQARVAGINNRRTRVLDEHSPFIIYQRPRVSDLVLDLPARAIDPAVTGSTTPDFLSENVTIPPEIDSMVALLRDAPVRWFSHIPVLLDRLDRLDTLHHTLGVAKQRAALVTSAAVPAIVPQSDGTQLGIAVAGIYQAQRQVLGAYRAQTAQIDLAAASAQSWASVRTQAVDVLSIGDLVSAGHGRSDVTQRVALEIEHITKAAAVLFERFGDVLPAIRLVWATRLSEFDAPANLRNLASLPRWGEIEILDRRAMQGLVDWMFGRMDVQQTDAVSMMNDIVRLCVLLASHAPVDRIIAGHVHHDTPLRPGVRVDLSVNLAQVRVGMFVNLYSGANVVARGVVEDLASGLAATRVVDAVASVTSLAAGSRAQLVEPERAARQGLGESTASMSLTEGGSGGVSAPAGSLPSLFGSVARAFA